MEVFTKENEVEMGKYAATVGAEAIRSAILKNGEARIILATGASQFEMLRHLVMMDVAWEKVSMYHLDEYCNLPITHVASFRKYLKERFVDIVHPKEVHYVDGENDIEKHIEKLTRSMRTKPIDVAFIGIGENSHIAFNDPPADFLIDDAYIVVDLDEDCKQQQVSEGWFHSWAEVPEKAISMTVHQILLANKIICSVPGLRKAKAIKNTLESSEITPMVPATILRSHPDCVIVLDRDAASLLA